MDLLESTVKALRRNGFNVGVFETSDEAKQEALSLAGEGSVGIGGSVTVEDMGIYEALQAKGSQVYDHWKPGEGEDPRDIRNKAHTADTYICSSNAIIKSGHLLNIDGAGNRVASMFCGPNRLIVIAGINKLAENYEEALERIKTQACPKNARRLGLNTPCAVTGKCNDCDSSERMCKITVLMERPSNMLPDVHIILVKENLGY